MFQLHNYQMQGVEFLLKNKGGMLLDEQGLGKTIQALYCIRNAICSSEPIEALIIVCPAIMQETWKIHVKSVLAGHNIKVLVHSYEWYTKVEHLAEVTTKMFSQYKSVAVIVDESHYIKNPTSKRTRAITQILTQSPVKYKILLTGTPITRDIDDLYSQLKIFYPDFCKSIYEYRKRFMKCIYSYFGDAYKGFKHEYAKKYIVELLKGISLRRTKRTAGIVLPSIVRTPVYVDISKTIAKESLTILDYATKIINGETYNNYKTNLEEEASHIATVRKALGIAKVPQTLSYIQTLVESNINKIVVFGVHVDVVTLLQESLAKTYKDFTVSKITGATTIKQRDKIIDTFQNDEKPQIIVANMVASGVGITLTASHTVVFAELDFTPSNIIQAEARVHRISQKDMVNSIFILANDSLDVKIMDMIKSKLEIIKETLK